MDATFVYVLWAKDTAGSYIKGVYATAKAAMAAHAPEPQPGRGTYEWTGPHSDGLYEFDADWQDNAMIRRFEVQS